MHCDGGLPVMPEINMEVALQPRMIQFSLAPAYQPSPTPNERNRRTIYAYHVRGQADPFTELFNQPNPNESCEAARIRRRHAAGVHVAQQRHDDRSVHRVGAASASENGELADADRITRFQVDTGAQTRRHEELDRLSRYVEEMTAYHESVEPAAGRLSQPASLDRWSKNSAAQPFEYEEILPVFESYEPDSKPSDVAPRPRALADMCLLLFNTNEFMYVE